MSGDKAFFDTNILLYMYDADNDAKRECAIRLFEAHVASHRLVISTQVVQEFYAAGVRRLKMPREHLQNTVVSLLGLNPMGITGQHILSAFRHEKRYRISFWDALIIATAVDADTEVLYTEDLNDGQKYGSVTARNPFTQ